MSVTNAEFMRERIESQIGGRKASEVTKIYVNDCKSSGKVDGLIEEFSSLQDLTMTSCLIHSLKAFPKLVKLKKLDLSDNDIGESLSSLAGCVSLTHLDLSQNKIDNLDDLAPLADLKNLVFLDLRKCPVTRLPEYRENVYKLIPSLEVLDGFNKNDQEIYFEEEIENENGVNHGQVEKGDEASSANEKEKHLVSVRITSKQLRSLLEENEEEDEGSEEESGEEEECGLSYLERDDIEDDEDDGDYEEEDDEEDEEIEEEEEDAESGERAVKRRKLEEEES